MLLCHVGFEDGVGSESGIAWSSGCFVVVLKLVRERLGVWDAVVMFMIYHLFA